VVRSVRQVGPLAPPAPWTALDGSMSHFQPGPCSFCLLLPSERVLAAPHVTMESLKPLARQRHGIWSAAIVAMARTVTACSTSEGISPDTCVPPPGSCDAPAPQMRPLDAIHACLGQAVSLPAVCDTSVNRCNASTGLGPVCAFAPDGAVFVAIMSDNDMLTAAGWRFSEPWQSFPNPTAIPNDQYATVAQEDMCLFAQCSRPCPGLEPLWLSLFCDSGTGETSTILDGGLADR
jgi:hypothetical protein